MAWRRVLIVAGAVVAVEIVLIVVVGLIVMYSGVVNVAAVNPDPGWMDWVLGTTSDNSVDHHAEGIPVSPTFNAPDLSVGYDHYSEMCVMCHGAPGVERGEQGQGLNPEPPLLYESVADMSPSEVFWVIKNGIKMTGMPAFGPTHDDQKIWNIAAFVKRLPDTTAEQYAAMAKQFGAGKDEGEHDED